MEKQGKYFITRSAQPFSCNNSTLTNWTWYHWSQTSWNKGLKNWIDKKEIPKLFKYYFFCWSCRGKCNDLLKILFACKVEGSIIVEMMLVVVVLECWVYYNPGHSINVTKGWNGCEMGSNLVLQHQSPASELWEGEYWTVAACLDAADKWEVSETSPVSITRSQGSSRGGWARGDSSVSLCFLVTTLNLFILKLSQSKSKSKSKSKVHKSRIINSWQGSWCPIEL